MGMQYPFDRDIEAGVELKKLDREARKVRMRHLSKNRAHTWWNGPGTTPPADIDDVVASEQLAFKPFAGADVDVRRHHAAELGRSLEVAAATEVEVSRRRRYVIITS